MDHSTVLNRVKHESRVAVHHLRVGRVDGVAGTGFGLGLVFTLLEPLQATHVQCSRGDGLQGANQGRS